MQHLSEIITSAAAIVIPMMGGFAWVVSRIDSIRALLDNKVDKTQCQAHRLACPCVAQLNRLQDQVDSLRNK